MANRTCYARPLALVSCDLAIESNCEASQTRIRAWGTHRSSVSAIKKGNCLTARPWRPMGYGQLLRFQPAVLGWRVLPQPSS